MTLFTIPSSAFTIAFLVFAAPSWAAGDPPLAAGERVLGADGEPVGTIDEVQGEAVLLNTGTAVALITARSLLRSGDTLEISATKEELVEMVEEQQRKEAARRDEYIAAGRLVRSVDSQPIGRIVAIEDQVNSVVILRNEGVIALRRDHFAVVDDKLVALFTRRQIDENTKPVPEALRQRLPPPP
ncbi:hypothetical protein, partial [Porphyrobacter sp. AAP60]|uniref:hypothetical protein n=1 Tax=Porphyrobacter sp. AAP60 TaxID=1523423 RepID=UPI0006CC4430